MNGRRIYHARGKVLGGSSSINGMIFQRGNPLDYERWAADPGMADVGLRALPALLQAHGELPGRGDARRPVPRRRRPAGARARPGRRTRCSSAFFEATVAGRLPAHRRRQRLPAGGLRAVRPQRPPRPAAVGRARLPAPGDATGRTSTVETRAHGHQASLFEGTRAVGVDYTHRGVEAHRVGAGEVILCGGAINTPQLLQLSGVGNAAELSARSASTWSRDLPGRRREPPGPPRGLHPVRVHAAGVDAARAARCGGRPFIGAQWLFLRSGPGATNHFEGGGFARSPTTTSTTRT